MDGARRFRPPEQPIQIVTPDEWPLLEPKIFERWHLPAKLAFFTGLRRGDVFALRKSDVDLTRGIITATISKTGRVLRVPVHDLLRPGLEAALRTRRSSRPAGRRRGRPSSATATRR